MSPFASHIFNLVEKNKEGHIQTPCNKQFRKKNFEAYTKFAKRVSILWCMSGLILFFFTETAVSQKKESVVIYRSEILDALHIADILNNPDSLKKVLAIYDYYIGAGKNPPDDAASKFIWEKIKVLEENINLSSFASTTSTVEATSSNSFLSAPVIADGLAKFIIERAKQELYQTFFKNISDWLNKYPVLKALFPQTVRHLQAVGKEIYNFSIYIQALRESFKNDLSNLPSGIRNAEDKAPLSTFFQNHPQIRAILNSGLFIVDELKENKHPGVIIEDIDLSEYDNINDGEAIKRTLFTIKLLSHSLRDTAKDTYWVKSELIKKIVNNKDDIGLAAYFSLLSLSAKKTNDSLRAINSSYAVRSEYINSLKSVLDFIFENRNIREKGKRFLVRLSDRTRNIELTATAILTKFNKNQSINFDDYSAMSNALVDFLQLPLDSDFKELAPQWAKDASYSASTYDYNKIVTSLQAGSNLYIDVSKRSYSAAIIELKVLLENIIDPKIISKLSNQLGIELGTVKSILNSKENQSDLYSLLKKVEGFSNECDRNKIIDLLSKLPDFPNKSNLINEANRLISNEQTNSLTDGISLLLKAGSFIAAIAQAQSGDEVNQALEAAALPVGSSQIKKKNRWDIALNSYIGGQYSVEHYSGKTSQSFGFATPIGISFSLGLCPDSNWGSLSIFISVLDIGAVASYRINDTSNTNLPTFSWQNILAPGIHLSYGLWFAPISISIGAEYGPALETVNSQNIVTREGHYYRFITGLTLDIPIFDIFTSRY